MRSWHEALAQLVAAGVALDLTPLWASYAKDEDPRRVVRPKMTLQLTGSNYGKPYPPPQGAAALTPPNHTTDDPEATVNKSQPEARPSTSSIPSVSYTHLRAHETVLDLVCRLLLEKQKTTKTKSLPT